MTHYRGLNRRGPMALVEVVVARALRHQIRAHFAGAGFPLVNDRLYGAAPEPGLAPGRHGLHACRLAWSGTADIPGFDVTEPLPGDLRDCLEGDD